MFPVQRINLLIRRIIGSVPHFERRRIRGRLRLGENRIIQCCRPLVTAER